MFAEAEKQNEEIKRLKRENELNVRNELPSGKKLAQTGLFESKEKLFEHADRFGLRCAKV